MTTVRIFSLFFITLS